MIPFLEAMAKASSGPFAIVTNLVGLVASLLILLGGVQMLRKKSWGLALTGSIVAMLPVGSCCCIGLPIGIWALVVLLNADVKNSFR